MGSNGTPQAWRCSVTCVITHPLVSPGNEHNADTPSRPMAVTALQHEAGPGPAPTGRTGMSGSLAGALAAADDHLLEAAFDAAVAALSHRVQVAGVRPARRAGCPCGGRRAAGVSLHHVVAA